MVGLNISLSLSLNRRLQNIKSLRLVLFFPFRCCLGGSLQFCSMTVKHVTIPLQFPRCFLLFTRKTLGEKLISLNVCKAIRKARALQAASSYRRPEFLRETHTPLWLLIGRIIIIIIILLYFILFILFYFFFSREKQRLLFRLPGTPFLNKHFTAQIFGQLIS